MKTTKEILYDNYDINITNEPIANCPNTKWYSEEEIIKARHHVQVFINIDRDLHNKVTMDDVDKGLDEFLKILKIGDEE